MRRPRRNALLVMVIAVFSMSLTLTAMAASEGEEGATEEDGAAATTTTIQSGLVPAVDATVEEPPVAEVDWTYRYMIPTALALAAIVVLITAIKYFTDVVRKRYRIVQE
jgi:hypothetical protein